MINAKLARNTTAIIDNIVPYALASLFCFELESKPEKHNREWTTFGSIFCTIRQTDPSLQLLLNQLSNAAFDIDDWPVVGVVGNRTFIGRDGNFQKRVQLSVKDKFLISLKQECSEPSSISGSPYSVGRLISAQEFDAQFGRADQSKRKRSDNGHLRPRKKLRI